MPSELMEVDISQGRLMWSQQGL